MGAQFHTFKAGSLVLVFGFIYFLKLKEHFIGVDELYRGFHCDISINAYIVSWLDSPPPYSFLPLSPT
jgi:hypothetical protein